jgi:hypothetical protein
MWNKGNVPSENILEYVVQFSSVVKSTWRGPGSGSNHAVQIQCEKNLIAFVIDGLWSYCKNFFILEYDSKSVPVKMNLCKCFRSRRKIAADNIFFNTRFYHELKFAFRQFPGVWRTLSLKNFFTLKAKKNTKGCCRYVKARSRIVLSSFWSDLKSPVFVRTTFVLTASQLLV